MFARILFSLVPIFLVACGAGVVDPTDHNHPPVAHAGPDQAVSLGALVRLSCAGSTDADGDYLRCEYRQISGDAVRITQLDEKTITFFAPTNPTALRFELVVWDGKDDGYGYDTLLVSVQ